MLTQELKTINEYYEKECWEEDIFLKILENKYPNIYERTIHTLNETCKYNGDDTNYTEEELKEIFFTVEIIDIFEKLYFEDKKHTDDLVIKYYIKENIETELGTFEKIIKEGYKIIGD